MADTALKIANDFKKELDQLLETMQNDSNATLNFKTALAIDMIYEQLDLENLVDNFPEITGKIGELQESLIKDQEIARENIRKLENELERLPRNSVDRRVELEGKIEIETAQLNFMEDFSEKLKEHAVKFNNYSYEQEYEQAVPKDPLQEELAKNVQDVMGQTKEPEKAEQPVQEQAEPKDVFHLTREELIGILSMDGTYQEMETAIKNKELTEKEKDHILSFLQADTQEKADKAFEQVMDDIKSAPTYKENQTLEYWAKQREESANGIKELKNDMAEYVRTRDSLQKNLESIQKMEGISPEDKAMMEKTVTDSIDRNAKELAVKTYQLSALTLMHDNAKSREAQIIASQHDEIAKKRREALHQSWEKITSHTHDMSQYVKNMGKTLSLSNEFNRSDLGEKLKEHIPIIRQKTNKYLIEDSKQCLKNINEYKKEAKSIEDKIREKADKISMKEYKREHRFDGVKKLLGRPIDPDGPKQHNTKEALEKLKDGNWFQKLQAKVLEKQLEKQHKYIKDEYARLEKNTERVRENVLRQRAKLHAIDKQAQELDKNNVFSKGLANAELEALKRTQFSEATLGGDLADYYARRGLDDMKLGNQINLDLTRNDDKYLVNQAVKELLKEDDVKMVNGKLYDFSEAVKGKDGKVYGAKEITDPVDFRDKLIASREHDGREI